MAIRDLQGAFTRLSVTHHFEVVDDAETTFRSEHKYDVRAEIETRFFMRQYFWTGTSVDEPPPELVCDYDTWGFPLHKLHGPVLIENQSRTVLVDLGRTFRPGDQDTLHFKHRLKDLGKTFDPHIGHKTHAGTTNLKLSVLLPPMLSENVTFELVMVDTGTVAETERLAGIDEGGKLKFERTVPNPASGNHNYLIRWRRPDSQAH